MAPQLNHPRVAGAVARRQQRWRRLMEEEEGLALAEEAELQMKPAARQGLQMLWRHTIAQLDTLKRNVPAPHSIAAILAPT